MIKLSEEIQKKIDRAAAERAADEKHVKQLTDEFVAGKTQNPPQYLSETARNLMKVATGKDNDPTAVARATKELQRFRNEPIVEEFFQTRERIANEQLFADRVAALKRAGLVKKIGGASETRTS